MSVRLDHTIVHAHDKQAAATFLAELLGLPPPVANGKFLAVALDHGLTLDFADAPGDIRPQHYAFAVGDADFDAVLERVRARAIPYWADHRRTRPGEIDQRGASRAIYLADPSGHWLEVLT
jgi:catechol 2,3-dioxygenase-like lactoylglutathione lyase family enzyme